MICFTFRYVFHQWNQKRLSTNFSWNSIGIIAVSWSNRASHSVISGNFIDSIKIGLTRLSSSQSFGILMPKCPTATSYLLSLPIKSIFFGSITQSLLFALWLSCLSPLINFSIVHSLKTIYFLDVLNLEHVGWCHILKCVIKNNLMSSTHLGQ